SPSTWRPPRSRRHRQSPHLPSRQSTNVFANSNGPSNSGTARPELRPRGDNEDSDMSKEGQPGATPRRRESAQALNGATRYYRRDIDPDENFNRIEITLSHLFRQPSRLLGGHTYGSALHAYMMRHDLLRHDIAEIGGGLGDVMRCLLEADAGRTIRR